MGTIKKYYDKIRGNKTYFIIAIIIAIMFLSIFFRFISTKVSDIMMGLAMRDSMTPKVVTGTVEDADVYYSIEAPGRIVPLYSVDLVARVSGYLQKQHYKDGDYVKKGQVLFTIEQSEYSIAVSNAKANLASARAGVKKANADYIRAKELVAKDYISRATYDDRLAQRDMANAQMQSATAVLKDAQRNYSYTRIISPIDGKVGDIKITEGNYVNAQSGALAHVVSIDPILVSYSLDSAEYMKLRTEQAQNTTKTPLKVELTLANNTPYAILGVQDFVDNEIAQNTGTIKLRATFKNPDKILIPGDFVRAKVTSNIATREVIVPQRAVLQDSTGKYVFKIGSDNKAILTRIKVAGQYENNWVVTTGLNKGDNIIVEGALKVQDGVKVKTLTREEYIQEFGEDSQGEEKK